MKTYKMCDVLRTLGDDKTIRLFLEGVDKNGLTRKQFYTRLYMLKETGLVVKKHQTYQTTSTGIIVKKALKLIEMAIKHNEMLRAHDVLMEDTSLDHQELTRQLFDGTDNAELRTILLGEKRVNVDIDADPINTLT